MRERQLTPEEQALLDDPGHHRGYVPDGVDDEPRQAPADPGAASPPAEPAE
ncbi:hypothetical protein ABT324_23835 [Saccharopolyspora sp. NPDC000359]|uniref:hypothetical protein n=1 Tax=Saccharopolyspora sp. NPDC000359 TaxID=3154251 RepID=UPI0033218689